MILEIDGEVAYPHAFDVTVSWPWLGKTCRRTVRVKAADEREALGLVAEQIYKTGPYYAIRPVNTKALKKSA